mmetsp:Transcript_9788/g.15776  ORF Transcript_9788/g.15776 Transcript_9788/m.15776 type:complete len:307 (-) Transcript_9788:99-1019(-)
MNNLNALTEIRKNGQVYSNVKQLRSIEFNFDASSDDPPPPPPLPESNVERPPGSSVSSFTTLQPLTARPTRQVFPPLQEAPIRPLPLRERLPFQLISETGMFTADGNLVAGSGDISKTRGNFTKVRRLGVLRNKKQKARKKMMTSRKRLREKQHKKFRKADQRKNSESSSSSSTKRSASFSPIPASKTTKSRNTTFSPSGIKFSKLSAKVKSNFKAISSSEASSDYEGRESSKNDLSDSTYGSSSVCLGSDSEGRRRIIARWNKRRQAKEQKRINRKRKLLARAIKKARPRHRPSKRSILTKLGAV